MEVKDGTPTDTLTARTMKLHLLEAEDEEVWDAEGLHRLENEDATAMDWELNGDLAVAGLEKTEGFIFGLDERRAAIEAAAEHAIIALICGWWVVGG